MQSTGGKYKFINLFEILCGDDMCAFVVKVRYLTNELISGSEAGAGSGR